jgi:hypothetical protein
VGTGGSLSGGKAWPGRDADHSPPSNAEVKKEYELYLLSPRCASMERNGTTFIDTGYLMYSPRRNAVVKNYEPFTAESFFEKLVVAQIIK